MKTSEIKNKRVQRGATYCKLDTLQKFRTVIQCTHMNNMNPKTITANRATVTFHTSPEVKARLELLANRTRRSKSFLTNEAVERYLANEEDFIQDVEAGIADASSGNLVEHTDAKSYLLSLGTNSPLPKPKPHQI